MRESAVNDSVFYNKSQGDGEEHMIYIQEENDDGAA
jgi:hypothetical protein